MSVFSLKKLLLTITTLGALFVLAGFLFGLSSSGASPATAEAVAVAAGANPLESGFIAPASCGVYGDGFYRHPEWGNCYFVCPDGSLTDNIARGCPPPTGGCPAGQSDPHSACSGTSCVSVAGCGSSLCTTNADCVVGGGGGVITSFTAAPSSITEGQSTSLSWTSNQPSCSIDQGIGGVAGSGSVSVSPTVTTTYTLTCGPKTAKVTVLVSSKPKFKEIVPE